MLLENFLQSQEVYFQLARFVTASVLGVIFTRAVLMPSSRKLMARRGSDKKARHSVSNIVGLAGFFATLTVALQVANFGNLVTVIGTVAAAATVAIGFGMRDQVGNIVAGVFIHSDNPFVQGDYIRVNDVEGIVKDIRLRATVLNGKNTRKQIVPNSMLANNVVKNYTTGTRTKMDIELKLDPEKLEKASELLLEAASEHQEIPEKPGPRISYKGMEDAKMVTELQYWTKDQDVSGIRTEVLESFNKKAVENGLFSAEKEEG